ncbi:MAG: hypothetical protein RQ752_00130 [Thermohalobaculum sp.]|nr:hypothetical protein [Thermohalobaculum sp.]
MARNLLKSCTMVSVVACAWPALSATDAPVTPAIAEAILAASTAREITAVAIANPEIAATALCAAATLGIATPAEVVSAGIAGGASPDALRALQGAAAECTDGPTTAVIPASEAPGTPPSTVAAQIATAEIDQVAASGSRLKLASQTEIAKANCELFRVQRHQAAELVPQEQWTREQAQLFPFILDDTGLLPEFQIDENWRRACLTDFGLDVAAAGAIPPGSEPLGGAAVGAGLPPEEEIETATPGNDSGLRPNTPTFIPPPFVDLPSESQENPSPS